MTGPRAATGQARRTIVIAATPTSNGDLHVGHMAGPYLAGDVYARYLRGCGQPVTYTTCTDDSQSYVVTTARRLDTTPQRLCATSTAAIGRSLDLMGISMAGLPPIDDRYRRTVLDFVGALHAGGRLRTRTVRLPYAPRAGQYLYDGLVAGSCPACLADSCGGVCEGCGHPNSFDELINPTSTMDPDDPVTYREHTILVLPMEEYRDRLTAYFAARQDRWRPHGLQLIRELLARPLPDIPITIPGEWGIPAPFPQCQGQIIYPWVEAMPASMYATWYSLHGPAGPAGPAGTAGSAGPAGTASTAAPPVDEYWRAEHGARLVYFHGFDNVYHWGLMDLVLLMAHGERYVLPEANICNEFYDLAGEKFSTSRNHLIWSADLLAEVPRDLVRFYLALTAPEHQRTNFAVAELRAVTERRLVQPWNQLADALCLALVGAAGTPVPAGDAGRHRAAAMLDRFRLCYELPGYSTARAAETIAGQAARLAASAAGTPLGDLLLEVRALLAGAAPILVDAAERATAAGVDLDLAAEPAAGIAPFELPRLPGSDRIERTPVASGAREGSS